MDLERAGGRIHALIGALSAAGVLVAFAWGGWRESAGFLTGAVASYLNFVWLKRTVGALASGGGGEPPKLRGAVFLGMRYLILGAGAYAILKFSTASWTAALVGLFVPVAAVLVEIVYELIYAGTS
ncbi:MAG: ATP synthase subunit I [Bryobacteraceae bacterium]